MSHFVPFNYEYITIALSVLLKLEKRCSPIPEYCTFLDQSKFLKKNVLLKMLV